MRNTREYPVTIDEVVECLERLREEILAEGEGHAPAAPAAGDRRTEEGNPVMGIKITKFKVQQSPAKPETETVGVWIDRTLQWAVIGVGNRAVCAVLMDRDAADHLAEWLSKERVDCGYTVVRITEVLE